MTSTPIRKQASGMHSFFLGQQWAVCTTWLWARGTYERVRSIFYEVSRVLCLLLGAPRALPAFFQVFSYDELQLTARRSRLRSWQCQAGLPPAAPISFGYLFKDIAAIYNLSRVSRCCRLPVSCGILAALFLFFFFCRFAGVGLYFQIVADFLADGFVGILRVREFLA